MAITSRPTSSFCRPGQEQLLFACGVGGKGAGGAQEERICYLNISLSFVLLFWPDGVLSAFNAILGYAIF